MEKINHGGGCCSSGVLVFFSGINIPTDQTYRVNFSAISTIPSNTAITLNPTGYFISPSESSPILGTLFVANSNISDNSSTNLISISIYNSGNNLIHRDYKAIVCENLCGSGVPITPTPTVTPTKTPLVSPTSTPTPTSSPPIPPLSITASFDQLINNLPSCGTVVVRAKANGVLNQTYRYSFGTDMVGVDLNISNPSGFITIYSNPTYVYTTITIPDPCKNYALEFGLSDAINTVQSVAIFNCGNC